MTVSLSLFAGAGAQFFDNNGNVLAGGKIYTYAAGTSTPQTTYTTNAGSIAHANPIILDAAGRVPAGGEIWITSVNSYKFVLYTSTNELIGTYDNISDNTLTLLSGPNGSDLVGFIQSGTGAIATTVQAKLRQTLSVKDFGATGDGTTDDTSAIQAAVNYAQSLVSGFSSTTGYGVQIYFPAGSYKVTSSILVTKHGIGFVGEAGKGSEIKGDCVLFNVGDYTNTIRVNSTEFNQLNFVCTNTAGTTAAIKLYRTVGTQIFNSGFVSWYIGIDCARASTTAISQVRASNQSRTAQALAWIRMTGTDETTTTGETYTPGGGIHITDCEVLGAGVGVDTTSGIILHSCDGFYMTQSHFTGCVASLNIAPSASPTQHVIVDIQVENCYFDEPSAYSTTYNVWLQGLVSSSITMADGSTQSSVYQGFRFVNTLFRGSTYATNNLRTEITDLNSWYNSARRFRDIMLTGCTFKQALQQNVFFKGGSANFIEPNDLVVDGNVFELGNSSGTGSIAAALTINSENCVVSSNTFGAAAANSDYIVNVSATDTGTADNPNPAGMVVGNDLSKAPVVNVTSGNPEPVRITQGNSANSSTLQAENLYYGTGRVVNQQYKLTTTDATTTTIWSFAIPASVAGAATATVTGCNADGTKAVAYQFYAGFRNNGAASSLSTGTTSWTSVQSWNPDGIATIPTADLSTNTLRVRVTGVAAETWTWSCVIEMSGAK